MIRHGVDILLVGCIVLLALAMGSRLLTMLRVTCASTLEQAVMATGLGLGFIAYVMLSLGLMGLLKLPLVAVILLGLFLAQLRNIGNWFGVGWKSLKQQRGVERSPLERILTIYLITVSFVLLLATLCPPSGNDWDGLSYHLAAPKNFIRHGRIFYVAFDHHSNFPFTVEMLYMLGLLLRGWTMEATGGAVAAKLFHYVFALLCALTIYAFGQRHLSRTAGLAGAAIFLSIPIVASEATTAYADLGLAAFSLLAFYAFCNDRMGVWTDGRMDDASHAPLTGIFAGLAMGTKYSGLLVLGWLGLLMLAHVVGVKTSLRPVILFGVTAALIASPWYVKNVVYTRNPVYPFLYNTLGGRNWSQDRAEAYAGHQREFGMGRGVVDFFLAPWRVTMWPWNYDPDWHKRLPLQKGFEVQPFPSSAMGPALLTFVVPLLFLRGKPKLIVYFLVTTLFYLLCWFFVLAQYNRYLFPILPLLSLCAGYAITEFWRRGLPLRIVTGAALAASCVFGLWLTTNLHQREIAVGIGAVAERDYLHRFNVYAVCEFANQTLPPSAKIVTYGETRWFYLDRDYLWGEKEHHALIHYDPLTLEQFLREYRRLGITHVLFSMSQFMNTPEQKILDQGIARGALSVLWNQRGFVLLEVNHE
jgi:hypothetical protein